jgi:hypothetical protein
MGQEKEDKMYAGWIKTGQAGVIHGPAFGPTWLKGGDARKGTVMNRDRQPGQTIRIRNLGTQGSLTAGTSPYMHNLMVKNVVFLAEGKHALSNIIKFMKEHENVQIRAGIREGMKFEDWADGMGEYEKIATREDICRIPYYTYVQKWKKEDGLLNFLTSYVMPVAEFGISTAVTGALASQHLAWVQGAGSLSSPFSGFTNSELTDMISSLQQVTGGIMETGHDLSELWKSDKFGIWEAAAAKRVKVVMTSGKRPEKTQISVHEHSHTLPFFAKEICNALWQGHV